MSAKIIGKIDIQKANEKKDRSLATSLGDLIKCVFCPKCKARVPLEFVDDNGLCKRCSKN